MLCHRHTCQTIRHINDKGITRIMAGRSYGTASNTSSERRSLLEQSARLAQESENIGTPHCQCVYIVTCALQVIVYQTLLNINVEGLPTLEMT